MRIVLNGVETNNKGAELMLYAVLQEIERKYPKATVMLPHANIKQGYDYIKTSLDFRDLPNGNFDKKLNNYHIVGILRRLRLPYLQITEFKRVNNVDYFIDGSGFTFSDQWNHGPWSNKVWKYRLDHYHNKGTKIVFLPQAFGPIENEWTKKLVSLVSDKASLIFPREQKSYDYLLKASVDKDKIRLSTDFTALVEGEVPKKYEFLKGRVCVIPNLRMVDKGTISMQKYLSLMKSMIDFIRIRGYEPFLLNHEGAGDEDLCYKIRDKVGKIEVVTGLNALEVKGIISISYLCITSRFHGLASALNSCVPCLALGWSHKYEELYKDYGVSNCMLDINDSKNIQTKIEWLLNPQNNNQMREHLAAVKPDIQSQIREMWDQIWALSK